MRQRCLRWRGNSYFITVPVTGGQHVVSYKERKKNGHKHFGKNCYQIATVSNKIICPDNNKPIGTPSLNFLLILVIQAERVKHLQNTFTEISCIIIL